MTNAKQHAWLGLGGNIGDVVSAFESAIALLQNMPGLSLSARSSNYKTPPWGPVEQDWFLNCVVRFDCNLSPLDLLKACQSVENKLKRERTQKWGPRTIDLDILWMEQGAVETPGLSIPHPRMFERAFVMVPFAEIDPDLIINAKSTADWARGCDRTGMEIISGSGSGPSTNIV